MTLPMSPASVFETNHSDTSSLETPNIALHHSDTSSGHPRLKGIRKLARRDAEREHAQKKMKKQKKPAILKSRRQESNIRSAEICRAAMKFYIQRLEANMLHEEETYLQLFKDLLDQIADSHRVKKRIQELEKKQAGTEMIGSSVNLVPDGNDDDEIVEDLLCESEIDGQTMTTWDSEAEPYENECVQNLEWCMKEDEKWDIENEEMSLEVGAESVTEENDPMTPHDKKSYSLETSLKRMLLSPVSMFDESQAVGEEGSVRSW